MNKSFFARVRYIFKDIRQFVNGGAGTHGQWIGLVKREAPTSPGKIPPNRLPRVVAAESYCSDGPRDGRSEELDQVYVT